MSIFDRIANAIRPQNVAAVPAAPMTPEIRPNFGSGSTYTRAGEYVSEETAKRVATAYRCETIISDDIASMPMQMFQKDGQNIEQVAPDPITRNMAYLLEVSPNRWMTPFIFKKMWIKSLIWNGNAYIWMPPGPYRELFLLDATKTFPVFDEAGNLWYQTHFPNGEDETIPWEEVNHLMINSNNGLIGQSVLTHARNTIGRQQGAHKTQDQIFSNGLTAAAVMKMAGKLNDEAKRRVKSEYQAALSGERNAGGLAVLDELVEKFEVLTIKPVDAQFLETVNATDAQIANFFGIPLYKLNQGKQSYESNEQQNMDYLRSTLNPYLVQLEQGARLKWLPVKEQANTYFRCNRDSLLQTDAKTRTEVLEKLIFMGVLTPNQALQINDMSPYPEGNKHYLPLNMRTVEESGQPPTGTQAEPGGLVSDQPLPETDGEGDGT